jgi:asparagine synthase (glutamine-hydrolysing)
MCGIAGIVQFRRTSVDRQAVERLTSLIAHRGPDGAGIWLNATGDVGLGHRRLAIIDRAGGHQPMASTDGRHMIVYNGEVYNFLELRTELEGKGYDFRTDSDTEVILAAWQAWGPDMLLRFNGMWALAICDQQSGDVFIARDRFGIKPLLYAMTPERFVFASEQRAIVRSGLIPVATDIDVARRLLLDPFGVEGSEHTLASGIKRLQGGHFLWLRSGRLEIKRWWRTTDHLPEVPAGIDAQAEQFGALFRDAVALRMRSDVPIGTCLSGGFDSSAVICTMASLERAGMGPRGSKSWRHAFVATFPGNPNDERPQAEEAAAWAGVSPTYMEIGRNDALRSLETILDDNDDVYIALPSAIWLIYQELRRQNVLVSLDGHGADELMGGYRQQGRSASFLLRNAISGLSSRSATMARIVDRARMLGIQQQGQYFLKGGLGAMPGPLALVGDSDRLPSQWGSLNRRLYRMFHGTVLPTILRNFDRLSMAHGIEVRMPFMDWRLVAYTMALPDASKSSDVYSKLVARNAMRDRMPESIRVNTFKTGFNSPMPDWLNGPLSGWMEALLSKDVPAFSEFVDNARLKTAALRLTADNAWDWQSAGRIWPYLHMKWMLNRTM